MKKLLVLALVLGMATMANAALTVSMSGPTSLNPGAAGTYTITSAGVNLAGIDIDVVSDAGAQPWGISGGAVIAGNRVTTLDVAGINGATGNYELVAVNDGPAIITPPLFTFVFTAPMTTGVYTLSMNLNSAFDEFFEDASVDAVMSPLAVTVIPEPMTMVLLGLGGLFLRRRK